MGVLEISSRIYNGFIKYGIKKGYITKDNIDFYR